MKKRSSTSERIAALAALLLVVVLIVWSFTGVGFQLQTVLIGIPKAFVYIAQMFPHSKADFVWLWQFSTATSEVNSTDGLLTPLADTIQMAVVGTALGALPAFPLSFVAARTGSLFLPISAVVKTLLNIGRAVPILVYAMIIIIGLGLGKQTGAVAIAIGSFVMLCKLYAEALESVAPGPVEAVKAAGGNGLQVFVYGMLPQVFPNYLSSTLYALELNLQASFILGLVGAGGMGLELQIALRTYNMLEVGILVFVLIVLVNVVDYLSYKVRAIFS